MTKKTKRVLIIVLAFAFAISMVFTGCTARKPVTPNNTGNNLGTPMTQSDNLARAAQTVPGVTSARAVVLGTTAYVGITLDRNTTGTSNVNPSLRSGINNNNGTGNAVTGTGTAGTRTGVTGGGFGTTGATGTGTTGTGFGTTNGTLTGTGTTGTPGTTGTIGTTGVGTANTTGNLANIKQRVASAVKSANTTITTVYVSTDPAFMNRLQRIYNDVRSGRTVTDFRNELNNLVRGITPERT